MAILHTLRHFGNGVGAFGDLVFKLDLRREGPLRSLAFWAFNPGNAHCTLNFGIRAKYQALGYGSLLFLEALGIHVHAQSRKLPCPLLIPANGVRYLMLCMK